LGVPVRKTGAEAMKFAVSGGIAEVVE